jgi:hypothetical protein
MVAVSGGWPSTSAALARDVRLTRSPTPPVAADDKLDRGVLLIASVVVLGAIMSILDVTVVNVAGYTLAPAEAEAVLLAH